MSDRISIKQVFIKGAGYARTADVLAAGIHFSQLKQLEEAGVITKIISPKNHSGRLQLNNEGIKRGRNRKDALVKGDAQDLKATRALNVFHKTRIFTPKRKTITHEACYLPRRNSPVHWQR